MATYRGEAGRSVRIGLRQILLGAGLSLVVSTSAWAASEHDRKSVHPIGTVAPVTAVSTLSAVSDASSSAAAIDASAQPGRDLARVHVMAPANTSVASKTDLPSAASGMSSGMELALQALLGIALIAFGRYWFASSIVNKR